MGPLSVQQKTAFICSIIWLLQLLSPNRNLLVFRHPFPLLLETYRRIGQDFPFPSPSLPSTAFPHSINRRREFLILERDPFTGNLTPAFRLLPLLLLSHFSRVRLCATPQTAAHQAPPVPGILQARTGVGCHFLLQCMKVKSEREVVQLCPSLSNPMDCSLPGSSAHSIFQARVLEWGCHCLLWLSDQIPLNMCLI